MSLWLVGLYILLGGIACIPVGLLCFGFAASMAYTHNAIATGFGAVVGVIGWVLLAICQIPIYIGAIVIIVGICFLFMEEKPNVDGTNAGAHTTEVSVPEV